VDFCGRKSVTKFVRKLLAAKLVYQIVYKWLVGDVLFYLELWTKETYLFKYD